MDEDQRRDLLRRAEDEVRRVSRKHGWAAPQARAFLQWGRHENAYIALRAARRGHPKKLPGVDHRIVRDLVTTAPPSIRRDAEQFATQLGVQR